MSTIEALRHIAAAVAVPFLMQPLAARAEQPSEARPVGDADLFANAPLLQRAQLVEAVLQRNPSVASAQAAWRAARAQVPQRTALADPVISYSVAPLSLFDSAPDGHAFQIEQMLPFPGKLALAGDVAEAEARAAGAELEQTRLELGLLATRLYDQWFTLHRALAINAEHQTLVQTFEQNAQAQYVTGAASQQDPLQAEVELAQLERQALALESERAVVRTQLNALLHRSVEAALPAPPAEIALPPAAPADDRSLVERAVRNRPELAALRARLGGARAALELAHKQYWPDLTLMAQYSTMWSMPEHRFMLGVGVNLPIFWGRRDAAVDGATARSQKLQFDEQQLLDRIRAEVAAARLRFAEARKEVELYRSRILPASEDEVNAARASFVVGKTTFNTLIAAERNLRSVQLDLAQSYAIADQRWAELARAVGDMPVDEPSGERAP